MSWFGDGSTELFTDLVHKVTCRAVREHTGADLAVRVQDRRVVTASEPLCDCGKREVRQLATEVHRHLASIDNLAAAFGGQEVGGRELEDGRGRGLDLLDRRRCCSGVDQ